MAKGSTSGTNIKIEADNEFRSLYNIDNIRDQYLIPCVFFHENSLKLENIIYFNLDLSIVEQYKYFLLNGSDYVFLQKKYHYKPDYLSYDTYGTTALAHLIMYLNNITSFTEFDKEYVYLPREETINYFITTYESEHGLNKKVKSIKYL